MPVVWTNGQLNVNVFACGWWAIRQWMERLQLCCTGSVQHRLKKKLFLVTMRHINVVLSYSPSLSKSFSERACVCVHACMHVRVRACVCVSEAAPYLWNVRTVLCYFHFIFVTWFPLSCCSQKTWGRLQRHEPSEQLMTPCFLAPCVTIWGL